MKALRETPTMRGTPVRARSCGSARNSARLCSIRFPNPMPGSAHTSEHPALRAAPTRSASSSPTSATTSANAIPSIIDAGTPRK